MEEPIRQHFHEPFKENVQPVLEGFAEGARQGAVFVADTSTAGMNPELRAEADALMQNAIDRRDYVSIAGFGSGKVAGSANKLIAAVGAAPALPALPLIATIAAGTTTAVGEGATAYYYGQASYYAYQNGDTGEAINFAYDSFEHSTVSITATMATAVELRSSGLQVLDGEGATSFEALSIQPGRPIQIDADILDFNAPAYTARTPDALVVVDGKAVVNPMVLKTENGVWVPGMGGFSRMPGETGLRMPKDLTEDQAQFLIESYPVEFGVSQNQVTGEFRLHSGTINTIRLVPSNGFRAGDLWWLSHTHPGGGTAASTRDMLYLDVLRKQQLKAGHPAQPSSRIFPWRGKSFEFTPYNPRLE